MVGVEPDFVELSGSDPVAFIISANLARRHMTKGQRAMAGVKAGLILNITHGETANVVGVSRQYVDHAVTVADADPDLADQVLAGITTLNEAYKTISDRRKEVERLATTKRD